ncbi:LuxR C-terminal-related transcriptional regulator [Umezawaea endophytica]|uniref:LuxR C-terminal-related transcriptional regulator n=1 Tax=Umezawaea endophytica TaxID=1654476 RepID=A0A9X2VJC5_9PSEU|nr:LuxR C-terminal-related transcriptional regulator [Umezawaea endophytica]MCS7477663.1 LuxR C-terminal-related transcriptional regulator [Umezawaea endophytica]
MTSVIESAHGALAGCAAAQRLCDEVAADPRAVRVVDVSGPGGAGKTALLSILSTIFDAAGGDGAVLVDDAHRLGDAELSRLARLAEDGRTRLVVAHRPWPPLSPLRSFAWTQPLVRLEPLTRAAVAERIAALVDADPSEEFVDRVWAQTGGMPSLVVQVAMTLRDGRPIPVDVLEQVRREVDRAPAAVHRVLAAVALGCGATVDALASVLGTDGEEIAAAAHGAWATGLLTGAGTVVELAREAVLDQIPAAELLELRQRVAFAPMDQGGSVMTVGRSLLECGARGVRAASALEAAGDEVHLSEPALAAELYTAAVAAGASASDLGARRAEAAALSGDLDTALRLAQEVLERPDGQAQAHALAAAVTATALAHRGMPAASASLYQWPVPSTSAVPLLVGLGRLDQARKVLDTADEDHPTVGSAVRSLMARGVVDSVVGSPVCALSELLRAEALLEPGGRAELLPDTPVALAALVAMHLGELDIATDALTRAIDNPRGSVDLTRYRLLRAWAHMLGGELGRASAGLREATAGRPAADPRDELFAAAIEIGVARRLGENADLLSAWPRARDAIMRCPVDLYVLQPIGEIAVVAARLRKEAWVAPHLAEAETLLEHLGRPPLWSAPLHWYAAQAAIAAGAPAKALHHASLIKAMADGTPLAATLAEAVHCWLRVLAGDVDVLAVQRAARSMQEAGLTWDAAQLAGQAAIRTPDRRAMSTLLTCARSLRDHRDNRDHRDAASPTCPQSDRPGPDLSDRELEVAELVVAGLTHRQIGERLFISAKTVEHHIARIRRRIGAGNRADLLAQLRLQLAARDSA